MVDLARDYGLTVETLRPHAGGFASEGLIAGETWFVKIWRGSDPPERLELLSELAAAGLPVPAPLPARSGELFAWWGSRPYAVFPFVRGATAGDDDWRLTAQALKQVHDISGIDLPRTSMDEPEIHQLRDRLDHPWIKDRRREVAENIARLDRAIERARAKTVPEVVCHRDFGGFNLLIDNGRVAAILDWEQAVLGPREHDLWCAAEGPHGKNFLTEYGARDLDLDHLEYALLGRGLRDLAARVLSETDRDGVQRWGFDRIAGLDRNLEMFRPFCSSPG